MTYCHILPIGVACNNQPSSWHFTFIVACPHTPEQQQQPKKIKEDFYHISFDGTENKLTMPTWQPPSIFYILQLSLENV